MFAVKLLQPGTFLSAWGDALAREGTRAGISRPVFQALSLLAVLVCAILILAGAFPWAAGASASGVLFALGGAPSSAPSRALHAVLENIAQSVLAIAFAILEPRLNALPAILLLGGVAGAFSAALAGKRDVTASHGGGSHALPDVLAWRLVIFLSCVWPSLFPVFAILGGGMGLMIAGVRVAALLEDSRADPLD